VDALKRMKIIPGDFVKGFIKKQAEYNAIATCFFVDTAQNIL